ncbi:N-acetylmuramate alpha-1-phosphate uridylyltransferase MurU [Polynucleobacter difficilis]|uniref:N-acetylmuramate alpha-1-phosphate uridylyltransferase MurU n=1 Tax=Polynucleobacter difficilis TaxID=556054 RepID=UPI000D3C63B2|nr:nucleotidyltransferase family protein [Polynucleobacter difficilis]
MPCLLLAAGRGERMRPLTDTTPKPLLQIQGKSLLQWHIEALVAANARRIVINHAWLGEQIELALGDGAKWGAQIQYSSEETALETAGGIRKALALLNPEPYFLVINGDVFCPGFPIAAFTSRFQAQLSNGNKLLAYLALVLNPPQHPDGDFYLHGEQVNDKPRDADFEERKLTFSGIGIYHQSLFADLKLGEAVKLAPLLRSAMAKNQVFGEKYAGPWHDVGTPQRLYELNQSYDPK